MNDIPSSSQRRAGAMLDPGRQLGLLTADRRGGELDYRTRCRGVWFDPSRLDKVTARNPASAGIDGPRDSPHPTSARFPARGPETRPKSTPGIRGAGRHERSRRGGVIDGLFNH
jgi:Zn-finger nucleic acid-binding protein